MYETFYFKISNSNSDIVSKLNRVYNPGDSYTDTYDWYDISLNYIITVDENGNVTEREEIGLGPLRTNTWFDHKWKAKANIWYDENFGPTKDSEIGEGWHLTSKNAKGMGDPFGPDAKEVDVIENADQLVKIVGGFPLGKDYQSRILANLGKKLKSEENAEKLNEVIDQAIEMFNAKNPEPWPVEIVEVGKWTYYTEDEKGLIRSGYQSAEPEKKIKGQNGDPDTVVRKKYTQPPIPKKDIPRSN